MTAAFRRLSLAPRQLVDLDDARDTVVRVTRGRVWLTQDGDPADHVLDAGDTWAIERNGRTIVEAQTSSLVDLSGPGAGSAILPLAAAVEPSCAQRWMARVANVGFGARFVPYL